MIIHDSGLIGKINDYNRAILDLEVNMSPSNKNRGKAWTAAEVKKLRELAKKKTPTDVIGVRLQRTKSGVRHKANELRIALTPVKPAPSKGGKKKKSR